MPPEEKRRFRPNEDEVTSTVIDGEAILINLKTGAYYSMAGVAVEVWQMIEAECGQDRIVDHLVARYGVDGARGQSDVASLCAQLADQRIILPSEGDRVSGDLPSDLPEKLVEYSRPTLNVYSDMADLLALDPPSPGLLDNLMRRPNPDGED